MFPGKFPVFNFLLSRANPRAKRCHHSTQSFRFDYFQPILIGGKQLSGSCSHPFLLASLRQCIYTHTRSRRTVFNRNNAPRLNTDRVRLKREPNRYGTEPKQNQPEKHRQIVVSHPLWAGVLNRFQEKNFPLAAA